jgi:hypothetical protein
MTLVMVTVATYPPMVDDDDLVAEIGEYQSSLTISLTPEGTN